MCVRRIVPFSDSRGGKKFLIKIVWITFKSDQNCLLRLNRDITVVLLSDFLRRFCVPRFFITVLFIIFRLNIVWKLTDYGINHGKIASVRTG